MHGLTDILECTTKPIIYDGDTGSKTEHFVFTVRTLERNGISAVIIEDKIGLKKIHYLEHLYLKLKILLRIFAIK